MRDKTIENIYLNQFLAEFDAVDPYLFIDVPGIVHKNLRWNLESISLNLNSGCWSIETRSYLKIRIFVQDQGEAEDQPTGILKYVEDLIRGLNADIGRKDFFEMASHLHQNAYIVSIPHHAVISIFDYRPVI